jgi:hypothetical protein
LEHPDQHLIVAGMGLSVSVRSKTSGEPYERKMIAFIISAPCSCSSVPAHSEGSEHSDGDHHPGEGVERCVLQWPRGRLWRARWDVAEQVSSGLCHGRYRVPFGNNAQRSWQVVGRDEGVGVTGCMLTPENRLSFLTGRKGRFVM